ncbi:MAG: hypothetical protein PHD04_02020 [Candidatus Pacebacteria bacterium]|nr:hypothetical protein [Candidatus Paceibacterota bacterium]
MIRGFLIFLTFISTVLFPWPLTAILTVIAALFEPLLPFAVGLFADTLYWTPESGLWPLPTLCGALLTVLSFFVRSRLGASIIGR